MMAMLFRAHFVNSLRPRDAIWQQRSESKLVQVIACCPTAPCHYLNQYCLTLWGRVTHICVSKLTIIGSYNGLSPGRRQAIIWTNAGILLIRTLGTNFSEILSKIHTFSFKNMHFKMSSAKWRQLCLGLNVLIISEVLQHSSEGNITRNTQDIYLWYEFEN